MIVKFTWLNLAMTLTAEKNQPCFSFRRAWGRPRPARRTVERSQTSPHAANIDKAVDRAQHMARERRSDGVCPSLKAIDKRALWRR
jgi:hypothetical protein